jgi:4-amino-4-deoxy-L-arabinose transferase-like glycosyltransferase
MAITLALLALLIVYRALETRPDRIGARPTWRDPMILAGMLAGVAAAARLHSIAAVMPLLFLILIFDERTRRRQKYPRWTLSAAVFLLPLVFVAGAVCYWWAKSQVAPEYPHAASLFSKAGIALAVAPVAAWLLYRVEKTRPLLLRVAGPEAVKIGMGCIGGFLLTNFTIIPQYRAFLDSVEMYSGTYVDWQRTTWPLWTNIRWYIGFYMKVFAPDTVLVILFVASAVWIAVSRNRRLLPFLLVFLAFFVSKPLNLRAAPHHTLLWLPVFAILCAFPVARIYSILASRAATRPRWRIVASAAAAVLLTAIVPQLSNGPSHADWIKSNTPINTTFAVSYSCFNPDVFYEWLRLMDVPVPASVFDGRRPIIWWGKRGELQGYAGYACGTGGAARRITAYDQMSIADPNQVVDVYHDPAFQRVASFGKGPDEVDLFRFDLRPPDMKTR